jgi:hypothetical protein
MGLGRIFLAIGGGVLALALSALYQRADLPAYGHWPSLLIPIALISFYGGRTAGGVVSALAFAMLVSLSAGTSFGLLLAWPSSRMTPGETQAEWVALGVLWIILTVLFSTPVSLGAAWFGHRLAFRSRRRAGLCPSCTYDLSGLPLGSPCPECAAETPAPPNH